jgi:hypothetical protein
MIETVEYAGKVVAAGEFSLGGDARIEAARFRSPTPPSIRVFGRTIRPATSLV